MYDEITVTKTQNFCGALIKNEQVLKFFPNDFSIFVKLGKSIRMFDLLPLSGSGFFFLNNHVL